ncbi:hypothetical protein NPIL_658491 [Nephila pilipes]|uniref:Uncharacterized protein n=1 Tax=Nephila pilipes TaxID=299642 RepID=A0A8X6P118_NEPPI|nr:hypothetical protein NPIL_658491 [Nephila pilipes]
MKTNFPIEPAVARPVASPINQNAARGAADIEREGGRLTVLSPFFKITEASKLFLSTQLNPIFILPSSKFPARYGLEMLYSLRTAYGYYCGTGTMRYYCGYLGYAA